MRKLALTALVAFALFSAAPAVAQGPEMSIDPEGKIFSDGQAVRLKVTASCPAGEEVLEAFVYVTQDGNQSRFAGVPVVCDGEPHRHNVRVQAQDFVFHPGPARASGYLLVTPGQSTSPGQDLELR